MFLKNSVPHLEHVSLKVANLPQQVTVAQRWQRKLRKIWRRGWRRFSITWHKRQAPNDHLQVNLHIHESPTPSLMFLQFPGKFNKFYEKGTYVCIVCKQDLFNSDTKYDSGCGWPAFYDVLEQGKVTLHNDPSLGEWKMSRLITSPRLCWFQIMTITHIANHFIPLSYVANSIRLYWYAS